MTNPISLETLHDEIDTSENNKIEIQEIEEFFKSSQNINKLGYNLEHDPNLELLQEFESVIGEMCDNILETKDMQSVTFNQLDILYFYIQHFGKLKSEDKDIKNRYKKVGGLLEKLGKLYKKRCKKYQIPKQMPGIEKLDPLDPSIPSNNVYEYFRIKGNEYLEIVNNFNEDILEGLEHWFQEFTEGIMTTANEDINTRFQEFTEEEKQRQKQEQEKFKEILSNKRETNKKEIDIILNKQNGTLSEEDIQKLLYFRDFYYQQLHDTYKNTQIEQSEIYYALHKELINMGFVGLIYIPGYDDIAKKIDKKIDEDKIMKELISEINKELESSPEIKDPLLNLKSLGIPIDQKNLNRAQIQKDIKNAVDTDKIDETNIKKYINIPRNIPKENYIYIANNFQILIKLHLEVNPGYKSFFGEHATGMSIQNMHNYDNYLIKLYQEVEEIRKIPSIDGQIKKIIKNWMPPQDTKKLDLYLRITLSTTYKNKPKELIGKIFDQITNPTKFFKSYKNDLINEKNYQLYNMEKLIKKGIDTQVNQAIKWMPRDIKSLELRLNIILSTTYKGKENTVFEKIFKNIPPSTDKFFQTCNNSDLLKPLKDNYALYRLQKNKSIKTDNRTYCFLDWAHKDKFQNFKGRGIKLSDNLTFDKLYQHTDNFYKEIKKFGFDATIPLDQIMIFLNKQKVCYEKIQRASAICEREIKRTVDDYSRMGGYVSMGGSPGAGRAYLSGEMRVSKVKFQSEKSKACAELEKEYVKVLLQRKPKLTGEIMGISGAGIALKFDKDPGSGSLDTRADKIVRDTFTEKLGDQREKFKYDLSNDRQAAFGSLIGMIGGIVGGAAGAVLTRSTYGAAAGFTMGLRLGNGIGQEVRNLGEAAYERISGNTINDGNNGVESFGQGFLRGVGALDQNYEYVGTGKFLSGLGFDYLSNLATFGLSSKRGGFLGKIEGIKFAGGALKFGMEELILENFLVDIPMNIVQTGFETFTGIDNGITIGNTAIGNQHTLQGAGYQSGSISEALRAMKDAATQNLSFENLSQTFFNTILYGGLIEGGGAAIRKIRHHLPAGQVSEFTAKCGIASTAFAALTDFMNKNHLEFNKDGQCIDTKTKVKIQQSNPRLVELYKHINLVNQTAAGVSESLETIMETQRKMVADPENKTGLLFRLGLISPTNTPLNILKKKKELVEKRLNEARAKGDNTKITQLQKLLYIYTDAETKLITAGNEESNSDGTATLIIGNEKTTLTKSENQVSNPTGDGGPINPGEPINPNGPTDSDGGRIGNQQPLEIKIDGTKLEDIINKLTDLNANELRLLMFKACNMGLSTQTILELGAEINQSLTNNYKIDSEIKAELEIYVNYLCDMTKINSININEDVAGIETTLDNIQQEIDVSFKDNPVMAKELSIEINKKKFELYKNTGNIEKAKNEINEIKRKNNELLSNDVNNFKYRRGLLESNLLEIQLGGEGGKEALDGLTGHAEEVREKTETIGGRTDTETLISKIEAGILLGKSEKELQPYLDFLVLAEHGAGINILGAVIQTINTTFDSEGAKGVLETYANNVTDAGEKWKDSHLLDAGKKAKTISKKYNQIKNNLDNDPNWIHHNEVQKRLETFVKEKKVSSISDVGNDFSHFTILLNPLAARNSPVMSIEIGKVDYETAYNTLKSEFQKKGIDIEGDIGDYNTFIGEFNKVVDNWIRTNFGTEKLQKLNSSEHRALFDYIAAKFMESRRGSADASLTNLSQLLDIKGVQDCRLHAFTKQLFFDSWKTNKLNNLEQSKKGKSPTEIAEINKQIKIIENTKMVFMDAEFSGNVDMNAKYVARTEDGHMEAGSQNNVIEEHTFNLLEMPVLDAEGNLQYEDILDDTGEPTGAKRIKTKVCFADSFYQGSIEGGVDTGKVYNLSYTGEDISGTIYGKKGEDVYMTTKVTDVNGKEIGIKVKPLTWSMKGRGDNITGSSIETRGPDARERGDLSELYTSNDIKADEIRYNRQAIQGRLNEKLDKLKSGEKIDLTDALKIENHEVAEWQANQLKRAFELYEKVPTDQKSKAEENLRKMIANTVTQNAIDFTGAKGDATEFLQTEGVFFNAMQIFNDVYRTEIEEAAKQFNPSNPESVKKLQDAIKKYQTIYEEDIQGFFKRNQETVLADGKRNTEYHRNNFEKIAARYQSDMEMYTKVFKKLENKGLYEQSYEIKKYMMDKGNELLKHGDKILGDMIDFKKVKKEMKSLKGRERYNQLKEIQGKENINLEAEFQKSGLDRNDIKEMTGMDKDAQLNKENLNKAISNIEESGLKEYYKTIALVFNPNILAIHMENTVYSGDGIYTLDTGLEKIFNQLKEIQDKKNPDLKAEIEKNGMDWEQIKEKIGMDKETPLNESTLKEAISKIRDKNRRTFAIETKEEYINRKNSQAIFENNINDNTQPNDIKEFCDGIVDRATQKLTNGNETSQIKTTISELITLCEANGIKGKAMYDLCKTSTEALVFQTIESKTRSMGDHGINHISGNIQKLNTYLEAGVKAGKIPDGEVGKYKLMGALTHIFHDIGYAAIISKGSNSFDGSNLHPFTSKMFFDTNIKNTLANAKINTELIGKAIESHDGIRLNWGNPETTFLSMVNLSDNMALGVDKIAEIWSNPHLLKHISTLYALDASGLDIKKAHEVMVDEINKDPNLNENQKETLKSAIKEISTFSMGNVDFRSISPLTSMEFNGKVPTLSMFQGTNIMLVAEVCGISKAELEQAIKNKDRDAIIRIMEGPDGKGTKFLSQIIKPLGDYCDIYTIHDAKGNEYEKVGGKYNWNNIKADLLLGETLTLKDGNSEVLNYRYEGSTNESILAEKNSVYGSINMKEMLGEGVEARNKLQANETIKDLGKINSQIDNISKKIEKNERISSELSKLSETISGIGETLTLGDASSNEGINKKYQELVDNLKELQDYTKNGDYDYKELTPKIKEIQGNINGLLPLFIVQ